MKFALIAALVATTSAVLPPCIGTNGPLGINCAVPTCTGTNGPKDGPSGTPCNQEEVVSIPHYNTDPKAGRPYATTGDKIRTETGLGHYPNPPNHVDYNNDHAATPAPYSAGEFVPGAIVGAITPAYVQLTEEMPVPTPRPIGVLMAQIMENY